MLPTFTILLLLLILIATINNTTTKALYFNSLSVDFNPRYVSASNITIKPDRKSVDVIFIVGRDYPYDPWVALAIGRRNTKTNTFQNIFQYDMNICDLFGKQKSQLTAAWLQNFFKYGNLPKQCPILKGNYTWLNLRPEKFSIPTFIPAAKYEAVCTTYFRHEQSRESVVNLSVQMEFK